MIDPKIEITQRKIRTGIRKQAEAIAKTEQEERDLVWKKLSTKNPAFGPSSISAKPRKLKASWTIEQMQDIEAIWSDDLETEISNRFQYKLEDKKKYKNINSNKGKNNANNVYWRDSPGTSRHKT